MADDSREKLIAEDSEGYIGEAGELFVVEEWKRILFNGNTLKINSDTKDDRRKPPAFTFENQLGYADVEVDGKKARLLVVTHKVFELKKVNKQDDENGRWWEEKKKENKGNAQALVDEFTRIFNGYLEDLYSKATSLPFEIVSETYWPGEAGHAPENPFWRILFLKTHADEITDAIRLITARPYSSLLRENRWVRQDRVRRFSPKALVGALTRPGNVGLDNGQSLFLKFQDAVPRQTFDNPENQFVRFAVGNWVDDIARIKAASGIWNEILNNKNLNDTFEKLEGSLTESLYISPLADAGPFNGIPPTSTVLAKAPGYREIRRLWAEYQRAMAIFQDLDRAINLKQIDVIWEYWVLFELLTKLHEAAGGGEEKWRLDYKFEKVLQQMVWEHKSNGLKLYYNKQCKTDPGVYSGIPLRPDFLLEINGQRYVFDAKFRLDWKDVKDIQTKEDATKEAEKQKDFQALAKSADIVKMHAYRDAIEGVGGAFVLYPGEENRQYTVSGQKCETSLQCFLEKAISCPAFRGVGFFGVRREAEQNSQGGTDQDE